jgi:hypothetical protein
LNTLGRENNVSRPGFAAGRTIEQGGGETGPLDWIRICTPPRPLSFLAGHTGARLE